MEKRNGRQAPARVFLIPKESRQFSIDLRVFREEFPKQAIPRVFKEIMSACRSLEVPVRVAYLGPEGTFSEVAAIQLFGRSVQYVEASNIEDVFESVTHGSADYGVVPLENSLGGGVTQTLDALTKTDLKIRGETLVQIDHCLLSHAKNLASIKKVYSHPQALAQCREFLAQSIPSAEWVETQSTAAAAHAVLNEKDSAAIAGERVGELLGLPALRKKVQDQARNTTRFVFLAHTDGPVTGSDRTLAYFTTRKGAKGLTAVLQAIEKAGVAIHRLESRPNSQKPWQLLYFVDFMGHRSQPKIARLLVRLARLSESFKVLGSYKSQGAKS